MYPIISKEPRFAMDEGGHYCNDKAFVLATDDWYILGLLNSQSVRTWVYETLSPLRGGYYEFRAIYMETLPIPDAPSSERKNIAGLTRQTQETHTARRRLVEKFLRKCGTSPADSSSRNPLEQPWAINAQEFARRAPRVDPEVFRRAHEETAELTERILKLEREIDERVAALYGLEYADAKQDD